MLISDWSSDVCSSDLTKIYSHVGWTGEFVYLPFDKKVLKQGKNLLAIHVANTAGGAWLDAGIVNETVREGKPVLEARQQSVRVGDTHPVSEFACGPENLEVTYTSHLLITDLDLMSRPGSLVSYTTADFDGHSHQVSV